MYTIIIPVFNGEEYIERAIDSALCQNHEKFKLIVVDDFSQDNTWNIIDSYKKHQKIISIKNNKRKYALENFYEIIHELPDEDIVVNLDGDDQLAHENVLNVLDEEYKNKDTWMTYGSFEYDYESRNPDPLISPRGFMSKIPEDRHNRNYPFVCSHLRTYKAWLFKKIKKEHLLKDGFFYKKAPDFALMWPMIEMSGPQHARYIEECLYLYNLRNENNEVKVSINGLPPQLEIDEVVSDVLKKPIYPTILDQKDFPWK